MHFYYHSDFLEHQVPSRHPEHPSRLRAVLTHLEETGQLAQLQCRQPDPATDQQILAVHPQAYLDTLQSVAPTSGLAFLDPDTALGPGSLAAAKLAAGAVTQAVRAVHAGETQRAFALVRPPGHHAETDTGMGFCLFNSIAIAAADALARNAADRIAILDFDVHHGNGTVDVFRDRPEVLVCSSFQHPHYPNRLYDLQRPNLVHTPLPAGTDSDGFRRAIERDWLPAVRAHEPDLILVSAGFDGHARDPLSDWQLQTADYRWITELIVDLAETHSGGRLVSTLEGGYDLQALAASVAAHLAVLQAGAT